MKVSELISKLMKYDSDLQVMVDGYEGGVDECPCVLLRTVKLNANTAWYYGKHELDASSSYCVVYLPRHDEEE